jgi:hypothetical protein
MRVQLAAPVRVTRRSELFGGPDDVGEHDRREHSLARGSASRVAHEFDHVRANQVEDVKRVVGSVWKCAKLRAVRCSTRAGFRPHGKSGSTSRKGLRGRRMTRRFVPRPASTPPWSPPRRTPGRRGERPQCGRSGPDRRSPAQSRIADSGRHAVRVPDADLGRVHSLGLSAASSQDVARHG